MKNAIPLYLASLWAAVLVTGAAMAQQAVPMLSSTSLGEIRVSMDLAALNKVVDKPVQTDRAKMDSMGFDTAYTTYKGISLQLHLLEEYRGAEGGKKTVVYGFRLSDARVRTKSQIGVGADKFEVIRKLDGLYLDVQPDWQYADTPQKSRYSVVRLSDSDNGTMLTFYFDNNKLYAFEVSIYEGC